MGGRQSTPHDSTAPPPLPDHETFLGSGGLVITGILATVLAMTLIISVCVCCMMRKKDVKSGFRAAVTGGIDGYNKKHASMKLEAGASLTPQPMLPYHNQFYYPRQYITNETTSNPVPALPSSVNTNPFKNYPRLDLDE